MKEQISRSLRIMLKERLKARKKITDADLTNLYRLSALEMPKSGSKEYIAVKEDVEKMITFTTLVDEYEVKTEETQNLENPELLGNPLIGNLRSRDDIPLKPEKAFISKIIARKS